MKVYISSHDIDRAREAAAAVEAAGHSVVSTWHLGSGPMKRAADMTADEMTNKARANAHQIGLCDALLLVASEEIEQEAVVVPAAFRGKRPAFPHDVLAEYRPAVHRGEVLAGYWVSSEGGVFSQWPRGGSGGRSDLGPLARPMVTRPSGRNGLHLSVSLRGGREPLTVTVHVLVAESFYGPRPEGLVVCHRNGNGHDNRIANLRYGTPASNEADKIAHGTSQHGERNPAATLSDEEVEQIRELRRAGVKLKVLAAQFGVAESTVSRIAAGIRRGGIPQIDPPGGKFVEAGVAIGRGKRVAVWGRRENILMHHPRVGQADDLLGAVALLGAVPAGAGDVGTN